jgi:glycosyltransferase involved in cell wall biosynthesis
MILSILTPAVPSRMAQLAKLCEELARQIGGLAVEHLTLLDNKRRTVGEKRDALLRAARGAYVAFVDDDDWISPDYVAELVKAAKERPDVITFWQGAEVNGKHGIVMFKLGNQNEAFHGGDLPNNAADAYITKRNAWHVCAWRRTLAIQSRFPASNYGEDWAFAAPLCALPGLREIHISKVLHYYRHSSETTEAPPP